MGKVKSPIFCDNGEQVIIIHAVGYEFLFDLSASCEKYLLPSSKEAFSPASRRTTSGRELSSEYWVS